MLVPILLSSVVIILGSGYYTIRCIAEFIVEFDREEDEEIESFYNHV